MGVASGGQVRGRRLADAVRRKFDFWYTRTEYRRYRQLNELVSAREGQICSGISGSEYVVYDQHGGDIAIDLSAGSPDHSFTVLWFDPASGREQKRPEVAGGARRTLSSPFPADSVLLLKRRTQ
jgi:hypothetical protein